jgi:hypothetical protein
VAEFLKPTGFARACIPPGLFGGRRGGVALGIVCGRPFSHSCFALHEQGSVLRGDVLHAEEGRIDPAYVWKQNKKHMRCKPGRLKCQRGTKQIFCFGKNLLSDWCPSRMLFGAGLADPDLVLRIKKILNWV